MQRRTLTKLLASAALVATLGACSGVQGGSSGSGDSGSSADEYPNQPITMIVPFAAGGGLDVTARLLAKEAEDKLGQPIVVENPTAAAGTEGLNRGYQATPDGYTLTFAGSSMISQRYFLPDLKVQYGVDSWDPIISVVNDPTLIVVRKDGDAGTTIEDVVEYAKANPDQVSVGVGGQWVTSDTGRAQFEATTGTQVRRVVFDGGAKALVALLAGDVDMLFPFYTEVKQQIETGELIPIAVMGAERTAELPDVPTMTELGYDAVNGTFRGLLAPKGTDAAVLDELRTVFAETTEDAEWIEGMEQLGVAITVNVGDDFTAMMQEQDKRFSELATKVDLSSG